MLIQELLFVFSDVPCSCSTDQSDERPFRPLPVFLVITLVIVHFSRHRLGKVHRHARDLHGIGGPCRHPGYVVERYQLRDVHV